MNSLCPLYFKSTFNQGLIAVLCLMANQIKSYTKLCDLCSYSNCVCLFFFFLVVSRVYLPSRIQTVGMTIRAADQRLYKILTQWSTQLVSHEPPQLLFRRHVNDDSKYNVYTVSDKRKLNINRKEFFQIAEHTLTFIDFNVG